MGWTNECSKPSLVPARYGYSPFYTLYHNFLTLFLAYVTLIFDIDAVDASFCAVDSLLSGFATFLLVLTAESYVVSLTGDLYSSDEASSVSEPNSTAAAFFVFDFDFEPGALVLPFIGQSSTIPHS